MKFTAKGMNIEQRHDEGACVFPGGEKKLSVFLVDIIECTDEVRNGKGGSFPIL